MSKSEQAALIAKAMHDRVARAAANRNAQEKRKAAGYVRIEKTVPARIVPQLRDVIGEVLAAQFAGNNFALRVFDPLVPGEDHNDPGSSSLDGNSDPSQEEQALSSFRNRDSSAKKCAQNARRRARAAAQGKIRATFQIPVSLRGEIQALLNRASAALEAGADVSVAVETPERAGRALTIEGNDAIPGAPTPPKETRRYHNSREHPLPDLLDTNDAGEHALFWDIKAADAGDRI